MPAILGISRLTTCYEDKRALSKVRNQIKEGLGRYHSL